MLRRSRRFLSEFEDKKWYEKFPSPATYNSRVVNDHPKRRAQWHTFAWRSMIRMVTKDSNRLVNKENRYGYLLKEIDQEKTLEKSEIEMSDLRFEDQRAVWFNCSNCGHSYSKKLAVRVKYDRGCPRCAHSEPSARWGKGFNFGVYTLNLKSSVLQPKKPLFIAGGSAGRGLKMKSYSTKSSSITDASSKKSISPKQQDGTKTTAKTASVAPTVEASYPQLLAELHETENINFIKGLHPCSAFMAKWMCRRCGSPFEASIRQKTGHPRETDGFRLEPSHVQFCHNCRWTTRQMAALQNIYGPAADVTSPKVLTNAVPESAADNGLTGFEPFVLGQYYDPYKGKNTGFRMEKVKKVVREEGGAAC